MFFYVQFNKPNAGWSGEADETHFIWYVLVYLKELSEGDFHGAFCGLIAVFNDDLTELQHLSGNVLAGNRGSCSYIIESKLIVESVVFELKKLGQMTSKEQLGIIILCQENFWKQGAKTRLRNPVMVKI